MEGEGQSVTNRGEGGVYPRILVTCRVANRMKGRAVVILRVDTTHFLVASEDSNVVGMKAVPQTPQGPRRLTGVFYEQSAKYSTPKYRHPGVA